MAIMTTQQPEASLPDEKLQRTEKEGSPEVNGHVSPPASQQNSESEPASKVNGDKPATDASPAEKKVASPVKEESSDAAQDQDQTEEPKSATEQDIASRIDKVNMEDVATAADTEMTDAPVPEDADDKASDALSPKSRPKEEPAAETPAPDVAMAGTEEPTDAPAEAAPATEEPATETTTDAQPAEAAATAAATSSPPATTDATADATVSDGLQPSAKLSRERDIDSEDEPVAKRTKVEHPADQVQVKTSPPTERMEVDGQAASDGTAPEPKKLNDDSLNDSPITEWQNKQIRQVLAGVKKTKVGIPFKQPVQTLWPMLWDDYRAKVEKPMDISTMEKHLRGDLTPYATMGDFKKDLDLMVQNAITFNGEAHDVTLQAKACREAILTRMGAIPAAEPPKPERKESKAHTTRHVEPRTTAPVAAAPRQPKPAASPAPKPPVPESPAFAIPPGSNGVPNIRHKPDNRSKRPIKPAVPKDLVYDTKRKKLPLELRFCDEVLAELRKAKYYDVNAAFLHPVDPVALNIPHYHKVIKRPMDLGTMEKKLNAGEYTSIKEFDKDFDLIIKNCKLFNGEDHVVYHQALRLQDLYRAEMSKKDEWMAKHAPVQAPPRALSRDDSESDEAESEADDELAEERKQIENRLATIQKRLEQEKKKVDDLVNSGTSDIADVEVAQAVVAMLQKQLMAERAKLAQLPAKKPAKAKPAKKKAGGGGAAAAAKKATVGAAGATKKAGGTKKAAPKRKIGPIEKEIIVESLGNLDGPLLERAIDLIKKDTGHSENDAGELELDIETVSEEALAKLYEIALKHNPNARVEKERQLGLQSAAAQPARDNRPNPTKTKKNKPMSRTEQERRIAQLNELRAQAGRQASGSQEPLESVEGNGHGQEPTNQAEHESEDEVDSEED
ncbi:hypothetical protein VTJ49DRAFT_5192 [Mycothermus thermophilus]|uniref:Uncharacterized protein n=1 Tax=Humicola insolens TaxID=85995 RepID=A0ABR3VM32_HUMIN